MVPFIAEFVKAQKADSLWGGLIATDGESRSQVDTVENGIQIRGATMDGSLQVVVSARLH